MSTPRYEEPSGWGKRQAKPDKEQSENNGPNGPSEPRVPKYVRSDQLPEMSNELFGEPDPDSPKLSKMYANAIHGAMEDFPPPVGIELTRDFKRGFNAALQALKATLALAVSHGLKSRAEELDESDGDVMLGHRSRKEVDKILEAVCQGIDGGLPNESVFGCAVTDNSGHVFIVSNCKPSDLADLFKEAAKKIENSETDITDVVTGQEWAPGEEWSDESGEYSADE